jgi:restriction system protein
MGKPLKSAWMVRSDGGKRYDDFRDLKAVGIGWTEIAEIAAQGADRKTLTKAYCSAHPEAKPQSAQMAVSQVHRFVNEIQQGDLVVTYSPTTRKYLIGTVTGQSSYFPDRPNISMDISRSVDWSATEVDRDNLSIATRNTLGSIMTVFKLPEAAIHEVLAASLGEPLAPQERDEAPGVEDPLRNIEALAFERIKDQVSQLDWDDMQELVAGILRAMNYKTQVSPPGSDLGRDILASPDGFGFEQPRIVVEVKHRKGTMGSQDLRSFLGGRHKDDRGLYVSTGGFTKDARYEADRSSVPLTLWTLEELTKALLDNYEQTDSRTRALVSLRTFYAPADMG